MTPYIEHYRRMSFRASAGSALADRCRYRSKFRARTLLQRLPRRPDIVSRDASLWTMAPVRIRTATARRTS